ncbi:MAG: nucleoside triphosphate pyrophosphohydrolase [Clostridia bacterium]|nr:nucleoside triphosphate pyrophosphohydrolase [Clostridia bacterium]
MKIYNKLVRDNIPNIIEQNGSKCKTRTLSDDEYVLALNKKLEEEVNEYIQSQELEEIADVLEVLYAIMKQKNVSFQQIEEIRKQKAKNRGGFDKKLFLESVE